MEIIRAFLPMLIYTAILAIVVFGFFAWYFGFSWL